jgi:hypothetical protein
MPRLKTPWASDSRHAAPPNAARQGGSSQFCPFEGVFHNCQNGRNGAQSSKATAAQRERAVVARARRRRTRNITSAIPKSAPRCKIALVQADDVRKNASSVRKRRRTDHLRAKVYDGDSAISAAIAAKTEPIGERGRD